ncbi:DUF3150 domain-containing protein [Shewanella sp. SM87]|jgi:hypothetical protein|uniref:DUF3150 domain-containing protein n=1 Tax=Shewanella TaxID=22 RepID=UPI0021D808A8|nr:DUF3150 domain-containing protein [Shewanella sp. SM87]MCU8010211.1 DUF3150 domain-containing protein [Shewanella sp. SM87]
MKLNTSGNIAARQVKLAGMQGKNGLYLSLDFSSFSGKQSEKSSKVFDEEGSDVTQVTERPRKFLVDKSALKFVSKFYMRAKRLMDTTGIPVWGGWLIPETEFDLLKTRFEFIQGQFDSEASDFVKTYEQLLENQCEAHPEVAKFIRRDAPTSKDVESRFFMSMSPPMAIVIGSMSTEESAKAGDQIDKKLLFEFSELSQDVLRKIGRGDVVGQKAISFLSDMEAKAINFSFLSNTWVGLAACLNEMRHSFPKNGNLDSSSLGLLRLLLTSLSNKDALETLLTSYDELGLDAIVPAEVVSNEPSVLVDCEVAQLLEGLRGTTSPSNDDVVTKQAEKQAVSEALKTELDAAMAAYFL